MTLFVFYEPRELPFDVHVSDNLTFYPHIHGQVELVFVEEGEIGLTVDGEDAVLGPGDLAMVFPNTVHSYHTETASRVVLVIFSTELTGDYLKTLATMRPVSPYLRGSELHGDVPLFLRRFLESTEWAGGRKLLGGYLTVVLGRIFQCMPLEKASAQGDPGLMRRLLLYIDGHFQEPLSLGDVARELGVSKYYLSRFFTGKIGCGYTAYVNTLRARYAEKLLLGSDLPVTDIVYEAGFDSLSTFYRAFRQCYGESPGQYRKRALHISAGGRE